MKNFISSENITKSQLEELFVLANDIKNNKVKYQDSLKDFVIATLFYEPSTRTRLSFESSIQRLGARLISTTPEKTLLQRKAKH